VRLNGRSALAVVTLAALLAGCTSSGSAPAPTPPSSTAPNSVQTSRPGSNVPQDGGYGQSELFCARQGAVGAISYQVAAGRVSLALAIAGLPRSTTLGVEWQNNRVRGYTIASFDTDRTGRAIQASLRMFRRSTSCRHRAERRAGPRHRVPRTVHLREGIP
jgi:hypothetical protein